jgi:hypothetical protein
MTKPITPDQARKEVLTNIPGFVIDAFNSMIIKNLKCRTSIVLQKDIINEITCKSNGIYCRDEIFKNGWLDIEDLFREYGWNVIYDKPAYYETYDASFTFTSKG